jgi:hypothetical protein
MCYDINADTRTGKSNQGVTAAKLYNLATDIGETNDFAGVMPDRVKELQSRWNEWNQSNVKPLWGSRGGSDSDGAEPGAPGNPRRGARNKQKANP